MASFGERLKHLRVQKKLRQIDMAGILGCTEQHYQTYEYNKSHPDYKGLLFIADYFDVSLDYLTGRKDTPDI
ncbi:MAG: helix-turn-helix domain-containing protein [Oscillospiraceae bacterium]|nr:helix-turn-helix domain-containing protein [Oscillospiraceae bacterium]